ncbi:MULTISPECIES: esterase/lipase family protein [unclassified Geodermatophilus]
MRATAPLHRTAAGEAPPWIGASPVAALLAVQRPWREAAALLRSPVWRGRGVPDGGGLPVLLVPGFLAGDPSLSLLESWLRARGYRTCTSQIRVNVDCTRKAVERLERRLVELTDRAGRPAAIVGQSRGGLFAKLMAVRRPDRVSGIITLGSPNVDHMAINPLVAAQVRLVAALGTAGVPGMFVDDCLRGACADELAVELERPFPTQVPYVSVYSRSDWVVDWHACVDPAAENVHVDSSHVGMSVHPEVYELLGRRLPGLARRTP